MSYRDIVTYTNDIAELLDEVVHPENEGVVTEIREILSLIDESAAATETSLEDVIRSAQDAL
jgi:hypothetical protein